MVADRDAPHRGLWINGSYRPALDNSVLPVINPSTESEVGTISNAGAADIDLAVQSARQAFQSGVWSQMAVESRAETLRSIAQAIRSEKDMLARLETLDCGKPIEESKWDIDDVSGCFEYFADLAVKRLKIQPKEEIDLGEEDFGCVILEEPLGIVAAITPWNYPLLMATWKIAPALAAGNCVILKPSELASITCLELGRLAQQAGLPDGVLNIVTGFGPLTGSLLTNHDGIDTIAFTGSVDTGRKVMTSAAQNLKPVSLELGGKSSFIVFEDADLENAVEWAMFGCFWTNGQICSATSRLLIHEAIYNTFIELLSKRVKDIKIGNPLESDCRLGPLISESQYSKVLGYIKRALESNIALLSGGRRHPDIPRGYFIEPTVFVNVPFDSELWNSEIFGPVLAVNKFATESEAIQIANNTDYGLANAVASGNLRTAQRVASKVKCGIVWINCSQPCFTQAPWGGVKRSGFGRDLGPQGLDKYLNVKQITEYKNSKKRWDWYPQPKL